MMRKIVRANRWLGLAVGVILGSVAVSGTFAMAATRYDYSVSDPAYTGDGAGHIREFSTSYSDHHGPRLKVSFDIQRNPTNHGLADAAWLVLSHGDVPPNVNDELAILYFDFKGQDLYAYKYDPSVRDGRYSWSDPANHIHTYSDVLNVHKSEHGADGTAHRVKVGFDLDISKIQHFSSDPRWKGSEFGSKLGIWFHSLEAEHIGVDAHGRLTAFKTGREGYLDIPHLTTTPVNVPGKPPVNVSEPAGLAVIGFGAIVALGLLRRRREVTRPLRGGASALGFCLPCAGTG